MHYGTFPILTGTPERLKQLVEPTADRRAGAEAGGNRILIAPDSRRLPTVAVARSGAFISRRDVFHQFFLRAALELDR